MSKVELIHYNHMNQLVDSYDGAVLHFKEVLGAQFLFEPPANPFTHACLANFGGAVIELVEKRRPMGVRPEGTSAEPGHYTSFWYCPGTTGFILDWDRLGPHFAGCEFLVADLGKAMEATKAQGLRIFDQSEWDFFLTYGEQCQGISFELTTVDWYSRPSPPWYEEEMKDASYWRDEHPLGITGYRFSVALNSIARTAEFFRNCCGSTVQYEEDRPQIAAKAIGVQLADVVVDFLTPTGAGPIRSFIDQYDERIRSMIFQVKNIDAVRRYFEDKKVPLVSGDVPNSVAIVPDQNLGVLYQFEPQKR